MDAPYWLGRHLEKSRRRTASDSRRTWVMRMATKFPVWTSTSKTP